MGGISGLLGAVALLGFLMFLAGIGLVVTSASQGRPIRGGVSLSIFGLVFALLFTIISQGILIVEPQQRAVVFQTISGELEAPRGPGTSIIIPILQQATVYNVALQEYTVAGSAEERTRAGDDAVQVRTIDGQEVLIDATVIYRINPEGDNVNIVHRLWQDRFVDGFIRPVLRGAVRDVISGFRAEAVYGSARAAIQDQIRDQVATRIAQDGFELQDLIIRNVTFSNREFAESIEQVQIAERRALEAEFRVQQERQEADRVRVRAEGERDAAIARAEGEAQSILIRAAAEAEALRLVSEQIAANPSLIQYEYVRNLSENINIALVPANSPFLFDFDSLAQPNPNFRAPSVPTSSLPALLPSTVPTTPPANGGGGGSND